MGVEADLASAFKTLVNDLKTLGRLPFGDFCNRLHNKARYNYVARGLFKYIDASANYPPDSSEDDWHGQVLDQSPRSDYWLRRLTDFTVAEAVDHVGDGNDPRNYRYWVIQVSLFVHSIRIVAKLL